MERLKSRSRGFIPLYYSNFSLYGVNVTRGSDYSTMIRDREPKIAKGLQCEITDDVKVTDCKQESRETLEGQQI